MRHLPPVDLCKIKTDPATIREFQRIKIEQSHRRFCRRDNMIDTVGTQTKRFGTHMNSSRLFFLQYPISGMDRYQRGFGIKREYPDIFNTKLSCKRHYCIVILPMIQFFYQAIFKNHIPHIGTQYERA